MKHFQIEEYRLAFQNLPENFNGVRIACLSDLHNASYGPGNIFLRKAIRRLKPDYIMIPGDMIVGKRAFDQEPAKSLMIGLAQDYKVFYSNGNHEKRVKLLYESGENTTYGEYIGDLQRHGVVYLENQSVWVNRGGQRIRITGLDLNMEYYGKLWNRKGMERKYLDRTLGDKGEKEFAILLAHNPDYFKQYALWGADLVLSGHIHGGIIRFPGLGGFISPSYKLFPTYDAGLFQEGRSRMVLSRGLGTHTIKIRINNVPEVSFLILEKYNLS